VLLLLIGFFMKLSSTCKNDLLKGLGQVYHHYVALDFFNTREFSLEEGHKNTLLKISQVAIKNENKKISLTLNNQSYELHVEADKNQSNRYKITLKRPYYNSSPATKSIEEYNDGDALTLLTNKEFSFEIEEETQCHVSLAITKDMDIGGKGKINLYQTHLKTLYKIIKKIAVEEDISNLLVALATGSGKTFLQALWMFGLHLSNNNSVFAIRDNLIEQFHKDMRLLLPNTLLKKILILSQEKESEEAINALKSLSDKNSASTIIVGSSKRLLHQEYEYLHNANPEKTFLIFDEQHELMQEERSRVRLIKLAKQFLSMFLTATPNEETYNLSGKKPVALMSSGEKEKANQGQFPEIIIDSAQKFSDKNVLPNWKFWTIDFWKWVAHGLMLQFYSGIQPESSSCGVSIIDNLPYYLLRQPNEKEVRWSLQIPMARKMLVIIDDNETLVNFCHRLQQNCGHTTEIYHDGNIIERKDIADFFQIPHIDKTINRRYFDEKKKKYKKNLSENEYGIVSEQWDTALSDQMKYTILHHMLEYVLSDLTGLDTIKHNELRKKDPEGFCKLIKDKFQKQDAQYFQQKLTTSIGKEKAKEISALLESISTRLDKLNQNKKYDKDFGACIDNWYLDRTIFDKIIIGEDVGKTYNQYVENHLMIGVMDDMSKAETPIEQSKSFSGLRHKKYRIYDNTEVKRRKHTALEALNDQSQESTFTPNYLSLTEEQCDALFKFGFIGIYVSNKKTEGFSDLNLHTVINLSEDTVCKTNSPNKLVQGIGRNRGRDATIRDAYIHVRGRKQSSIFDLKHLKLDDYLPQLFRSQTLYNDQYVTLLGNKAGQDIINWFYQNVKPDETIDDTQLKKEVLAIIARSLRQLKETNNHDIQLSRKQLTKVIAQAMNTLKAEIKHINKPRSLPSSVRILGTFINAVCEVYFSVKRYKPQLNLSRHSQLEAKDKGRADDTYIKIIKKTSFKEVYQETMVLKEFKEWLERTKAGLMFRAEARQLDYMNIFLKDGLSTLQATISNDITQAVAPIFLHAAFYKSVHTIIGYLNEADLVEMMQALNIENPEQEAKRITQLMDILKCGDIQTLQKQFISLTDIKDINSFDFKQLPIINTVTTLKQLIEEVIDCHAYYNNHDKRGNQTSSHHPKLLPYMSKTLQEIRVPEDRSFFSHFSRKIFFIQAIRNGLEPSGKISADSHRSQIKILNRINTHILRPLWWSNNVTTIEYYLIKLGRDIAFGLKSFGFFLQNLVKSMINSVFGEYFTISSRNLISVDYNNTAFDFVKVMNDLEPLNSKSLSKNDCPEDVVEYLNSFFDDSSALKTNKKENLVNTERTDNNQENKTTNNKDITEEEIEMLRLDLD
jgi:hypothetical protein